MTSQPATAIVWFRRDLRLDDNRALAAALTAADRVVPLFVRDPAILESETVGGRRRERLEAALAALDQELRARGGRLIVRTGRPDEVVPSVAHEAGASQVHAHRDHTPYARRRDAAVSAALGARMAIQFHPGTLLVEPEVLGPRQIFMPFHQAWLRSLDGSPAVAAPGWLSVPDTLGSEPLSSEAARAPTALHGETAALHRLRSFEEGAGRYAMDRDRLDVDGTSGLSADLHFGTLSPRRVLAAVSDAAFARQLAWRDWSAHVMWWDAESGPASEPGRSQLADQGEVRWDDDPSLLAAWREGRTGYPAVDAAMRQLASEGWLSNRARMIAASFLVKDLLLDWRAGFRWFQLTLVDADVASNWLNWRWVAGLGAGAAPFFRVMNPVLQGERHDPSGTWARRWVPELERVPLAFVHRPWEWEAGRALGYPPPVVDHALRRREALRRYRAERSTARGR